MHNNLFPGFTTRPNLQFGVEVQDCEHAGHRASSRPLLGVETDEADAPVRFLSLLVYVAKERRARR